jgi:hypothetical protein
MAKMSEGKKHIDESWKESADKEKAQAKNEKEHIIAEPDFKFFVTTLALQTSIALGRVPNPTTNKIEEDLNQAKLIIDTLGMLKEKTKGNLTDEETELLDNLLYELRMQYASKNK